MQRGRLRKDASHHTNYAPLLAFFLNSVRVAYPFVLLLFFSIDELVCRLCTENRSPLRVFAHGRMEPMPNSCSMIGDDLGSPNAGIQPIGNRSALDISTNLTYHPDQFATPSAAMSLQQSIRPWLFHCLSKPDIRTIYFQQTGLIPRMCFSMLSITACSLVATRMMSANASFRRLMILWPFADYLGEFSLHSILRISCLVTYAHANRINLLWIIVNIYSLERLSEEWFANECLFNYAQVYSILTTEEFEA